MPKVMLIAGMCKQVPLRADMDYIGIDHGAISCMEQGIPLICALGDFDSVTQAEWQALQTYAPIEKLPAHKNETDSEVGIHYAMEHGYEEIILYGGLGGRIDHELANLYLLMHRDLPVVLLNDTNCIRVIKQGTYEIENTHTYLSFLALEESCISEHGVAYPLDKRVLTSSDIYSISNEILEKTAHIELHYGRMLMIQSNDDKPMQYQ